MKQELKRQHFKEKYDFICCNCSAELWARPSMMMTQFGINQGHGSCMDCKEFLHLEIKEGIDGEEMISMLWDDFLKKEKKICNHKNKELEIDEKRFFCKDCNKWINCEEIK